MKTDLGLVKLIRNQENNKILRYYQQHPFKFYRKHKIFIQKLVFKYRKLKNTKVTCFVLKQTFLPNLITFESLVSALLFAVSSLSPCVLFSTGPSSIFSVSILVGSSEPSFAEVSLPSSCESDSSAASFLGRPRPKNNYSMERATKIISVFLTFSFSCVWPLTLFLCRGWWGGSYSFSCWTGSSSSFYLGTQTLKV